MKYFKKVLLFGIILIFITTSTSCSQDRECCGDILVDTMEEIGADILQVDVNFGGSICDSFLTEEEIKNLGEKLKNQMGIVGKKVEGNFYDGNLTQKYYSEELTVQDGFVQYMIWGMNENSEPTTIILSSYLYEGGDKGETTVFVDLVKNKEYEQFGELMEKKREMLKQNEIETKFTACIVGTFKGELNRDEVKNKIFMTISKINGKIIEYYDDENLVSVTAYSPLINNYIYSGNKKMNYNIAMRYNEYEDKTYIWIGTPIISIGY